MSNSNTPTHPPVAVPESWELSEAEIQKAWDEKADQFAKFKALFEKTQDSND